MLDQFQDTFPEEVSGSPDPMEEFCRADMANDVAPGDGSLAAPRLEDEDAVRAGRVAVGLEACDEKSAEPPVVGTAVILEVAGHDTADAHRLAGVGALVAAALHRVHCNQRGGAGRGGLAGGKQWQ